MLKKNKNRDKNKRLYKVKVISIWDYYEKNNLGYFDSFKVCYAKMQIHKVFDKFYDGNSSKKRIKTLIEELRKNKKYLEICYKETLLSDKDYRTGDETYGYKLGNIRGNLSYISDRFFCSFRIRWMLDLIERFKNEKHN